MHSSLTFDWICFLILFSIDCIQNIINGHGSFSKRTRLHRSHDSLNTLLIWRLSRWKNRVFYRSGRCSFDIIGLFSLFNITGIVCWCRILMLCCHERVWTDRLEIFTWSFFWIISRSIACTVILELITDQIRCINSSWSGRHYQRLISRDLISFRSLISPLQYRRCLSSISCCYVIL